MKDIGIELYEAISSEFQRELSADKIIGGIMQRIESGKAQSTDIARYANRLGQMLRTAIERNVSADKLPDGQMYYNIAEKILRPSLKNTYDLFNDTAAEIQAVVDQALGINIKARKPEFPDERIDDVIRAASVKGIPEKQMIRRLASPAENITQSYADDYAKVNADFRSRAGLTEYIIRRDDGNCCEWCGKLAGKYRYPDEVPKDVYRRHDNCGCTTEHFSDGTKTNVWSKQSSAISAEDRERMAQLSENRPTGFTPEEAAAKEARVKAQIKDRLEPEEAERLEKEQQEKQKSLLTKAYKYDTIKLKDSIVPRSVGAKRKSYDVMDLQSGEHFDLVDGTYIRNKEVFAGKGVKTAFRKAGEFAKRYGGNPMDWQHVKGVATVNYHGEARNAELHWAQCEDIGMKEIFVKEWLE